MLAGQLPPPRISRFDRCGSSWWVQRHAKDPNRYRLIADYCHDRFCVPCAAARAARIRNNLAHHLPDHPLRLVTLTLRHSSRPLKMQLDRLYLAYRRLRQRRIWSDRVRGACAVLEITRSKRDGSWHPHLHVILDGKYLPQALLRKAWLEVTGDSYVVDVRLIRQPRQAVAYVTKYLTKGTPAIRPGDTDRNVELIDALRGRRLLLLTGDWQRWQLLRPRAPADWVHVCHVRDLDHTRRLDADTRTALAILVPYFHPADHLVEFDLPPPERGALSSLPASDNHK